MFGSNLSVSFISYPLAILPPYYYIGPLKQAGLKPKESICFVYDYRRAYDFNINYFPNRTHSSQNVEVTLTNKKHVNVAVFI